MTQRTLLFLVCTALCCSPKKAAAQTVPYLGAAASFELFSTVGAISNTGISYITGNIGTGTGAITGFGIVNGSIHNNDALTTLVASDLQNAYNQLDTTSPNFYPGPVLGNGDTLTAGVYSMAAAASLNLELVLNAQGNENAVFIFKTGGAFTTSASSQIILINGAKAYNIFWKIEGAASFAAGTIMKGTIIANNGAISMGTGVNIEGRALSTAGAISTYNTTAYFSNHCTDKLATWTGAINTDWTNVSNWSCGVVPTDTNNVIIPAGSLFYPVITTTQPLNDITIQNNASLVVLDGTLQIGGAISNTGTFDVSAGTVQMNGTALQTLPANTFTNNSILNLIISNNAALAGQQNVSGTLSFSNSNDTIFTNGFLILRSTANGTARLADITNVGTDSGNIISGDVTIERYIPARRAWHLLAAPLSSNGAPTINSAWQEGVSAGNPNPGYGTHITGGTTALGFDQGVNGNASVKYFYSSTNLSALPTATGTNIAITTYPAYFLFVRGDRSTELLQGINAALSNTTLRMKGQVNTGNINATVCATNFTVAGNPYPSAIDFHSLTKNNVNDKLYLWDPKLGGVNGLGGYVTLLWNGYSYDATAAVSPVSQYIPCGQAFIVESLDGINPGTLTVKETDKSTGIGPAARPVYGDEKMRVNLLAVGADGVSSLSDGILTTYGNNNNNVDNKDAKKIYNLAENICIKRDSSILSIERRLTIENNDTTFLNLYNLKKPTYKLQLTTENMNNSGLYAVVRDNYSSVINNTAVNMGGVTDIIFNVNTDPASYAANRFSIVFSNSAVLPVTFTSVKATRRLKDTEVKWTTAREENIQTYDVETSATSTGFMQAASVAAKVNNGGSAAYTWLNVTTDEGIRYYRIKSIGLNGKTNYSAIVKVAKDEALLVNTIAVYPNTLKGNTVLLQLNNVAKGSYTIGMYNMEGRLIKKLLMEHFGGSAIQRFAVDKYLTPGKYLLQLSGKSLLLTTSIIK